MLEKPLTAGKRGMSKEELRALEKEADEGELVRDVTEEEQAAFKAMFPGRREQGNGSEG